MSRARQNSQSQSKVSLENQSRKQQKQQQERKIETDHQQQSMDRTDVMILVEILLPSASRFIAMNRMSLLHSTARTFWVTRTVSSQSRSLTTGLCWHLVALIPSSACGPSVKTPLRQFKWKLWHAYAVFGLAFAPDNRRLFSAGFDGKIFIHDVQTWVNLINRKLLEIRV